MVYAYTFSAIITALVQGFSQWMPISSKGHLLALQDIFYLRTVPFLSFLILAGVLVAIILLWKDIYHLFDLRKKHNQKYFLTLIISFLPVLAIVLFVRNLIPNGIFGNLTYVGIGFVFSGIVVFSTKFVKGKKEVPGWGDSMIIGLAQVLSLFPGVSRTGMTISAGMLNGMDKEEAFKFSLLLSIPTLILITLFPAGTLAVGGASAILIAGMCIITAAASVGGIFLLLKLIRSNKFWLLGIYDFAIGAALLLHSLWGALH